MDGTTDSMDMSLSKHWELVMDMSLSKLQELVMACCSPWGCKELDTAEQLNRAELIDI